MWHCWFLFHPSSSLVHSPPPPWLPLSPQWPWQRQQQQHRPLPSSPVWDTMNMGLRRVRVSSLRYVFFSLLFSIFLISTYRYHQWQRQWRMPTPTPASTLAMAGGALDEWCLEPWGFFSFFWYVFFIYLFLYSINDYPEVLWTTAMSANASNMSNWLMAGLEMNHVSSPGFFFFFSMFLFYIILMVLQVLQMTKQIPTPTLAKDQWWTAGLEMRCISSPKFF